MRHRQALSGRANGELATGPAETTPVTPRLTGVVLSASPAHGACNPVHQKEKSVRAGPRLRFRSEMRARGEVVRGRAGAETTGGSAGRPRCRVARGVLDGAASPCRESKGSWGCVIRTRSSGSSGQKGNVPRNTAITSAAHSFARLSLLDPHFHPFPDLSLSVFSRPETSPTHRPC